MPVTQAASGKPGPSALQSLDRIARRLERALLGLNGGADAEPELRAIAAALTATVDQSPDVALAAIYLNQIPALYAVRHSIEAAIVALLLVRAMGKPASQTASIVAATLTMNAGIVRLVEMFQLKDCALSAPERAALQRHPAEGAELLRRAGVDDEEWLACVLMHHELPDGSGYPEGRREVPDGARLVGLADRYCALVSARNYRRSLTPPDACRRLAQGDDVLAALLATCIGRHPPGTLVRLACGEVGVVASRDGPLVHVLRDAGGAEMSQLRTARGANYAIETALHEDDARLRFTMRQVWGEAAAV